MENIKTLTDSQLADAIRSANDWLEANDKGLLQELCSRADLSSEWKDSDGDTFESVIRAAAKKLSVDVGI